MINAAITKDEWTPALEEYLRRWKTLSSTERRISRIVQNSIRQNYLTEGAHSGLPWKPRTRPYSWPALRKSGRMMAYQLAAAAGRFSYVNGMHVIDFSDVLNNRRAKLHHRGTRYMPARKTFRLNEDEKQQSADLLGTYMLKPK